jgi:cell division protein FtsQ
LRPLATDVSGVMIAAPAAAAAPRVGVLPRFLRRPARVLQRRQWRLPHRFGLKAFVVFAIATVIAGVVTGGRALGVVSAVSAWSGLAITEVKITGQSETSELAVLDRLDIKHDPSLLTYDVDAARARIALLPWVDSATLKKLFPNTLEVVIAERRPFAIWQHGSELSLVDAAGKVITDAIDERYAHLPFVAGPGAAERAREFVDLIDGQPDIAGRVRAGVLISGERWNVVLDNGVELMLPADKPAAALARVATLDAEKKLLSREITAVDMRLPDQMIVRLDADGLAARKDLLKEREKLARRQRTNT